MAADIGGAVVAVSPAEEMHSLNETSNVVVQLVPEFEAVGKVGACTGTLISPRHVLTAAHCTLADSASFTLNGHSYPSAEITTHPAYVHGHPNRGFDISIITLMYPVEDIEPIEISFQSPVAGQSITFVGYGPESPTDFVRTTDLDAVSAKFVAWQRQRDDDPYFRVGDSGGPFLLHDGQDYTVVGVASHIWTSSPADPPERILNVHVGTRIDTLADWMDAIVRGREPVDPDAGEISLGDTAHVRGEINWLGDMDRFSFTIDTPSQVTIHAQPENAPDVVFTVYNDRGELIARDYRLESFREAQLRENDGLHLAIPAGTYYVDVNALDNRSVGEYTFEIVAGEQPELQLDQRGRARIHGRARPGNAPANFALAIDESYIARFDVGVANHSSDPIRILDAAGDPVALVGHPGRSDLAAYLRPGRYVVEIREFPIDNPADGLSLKVQEPLPGDLNLDGHVDFSDFVVLSANYGKRSDELTFFDGDFDVDGDVDFRDFLQLSANWTGHAGGSASTSVGNEPRSATYQPAQTKAASSEHTHDSVLDEVFASLAEFDWSAAPSWRYPNSQTLES